MRFTFALVVLAAVVHGSIAEADCSSGPNGLGFPDKKSCDTPFQGHYKSDKAAFCKDQSAFACCYQCDDLRKAVKQKPLVEPDGYCKTDGDKCKVKTACINAGGKECGLCMDTKGLCGNKQTREGEEVGSFLLQAPDRTGLILGGCSVLLILGAALWYDNYRKTGDEYQILLDEEEA